MSDYILNVTAGYYSTHHDVEYITDPLGNYVVDGSGDKIVSPGSITPVTFALDRSIVCSTSTHLISTPQIELSTPPVLSVNSAVHSIVSTHVQFSSPVDTQILPHNSEHIVDSYVYEIVVDNKISVVKNGEQLVVRADLTLIVNENYKVFTDSCVHSVLSQQIVVLPPHAVEADNTVHTVTSQNAQAIPPYEVTASASVINVASTNPTLSTPTLILASSTTINVTSDITRALPPHELNMRSAMHYVMSSSTQARSNIVIPYVANRVHTITSTEPAVYPSVPIYCDNCVHSLSSTSPVLLRRFTIRIPAFGCPGTLDLCNNLKITSPEIILNPQIRIPNVFQEVEIDDANSLLISQLKEGIEVSDSANLTQSSIYIQTDISDTGALGISSLYLQVEVDADIYESKIKGYIWLF